MHGHSMRENREVLCSPAEVGWDASGRPRPYADDERAEEVGQARSTDEAAEQGRWYTAAEVVEGRSLAKEKVGEQNTPQTQSWTMRVQCAPPPTPSGSAL